MVRTYYNVEYVSSLALSSLSLMTSCPVLLSLLTAVHSHSIGTVQLAMALRKTKFSPYGLNQTMRNVVTDFAVVTSIAFWTIVSTFVFPTVQLETLNVPDTFAPTFECCTEMCDKNWPEQCPELVEPFGRRPWKVNMMDFGSSGAAWVPFMAAGPAILAFILVFLDDGITWHLINHPSHKVRVLLFWFGNGVLVCLGCRWLFLCPNIFHCPFRRQLFLCRSLTEAPTTTTRLLLV